MFHAASSRREARVALVEVIEFLEDRSRDMNESHHGELSSIAVEAGASQQLADLASAYVVGYWPMWLDADAAPIARTAMRWFEQRWSGPPWGFEPNEIASNFGFVPGRGATTGMAIATLDRLARRVGIDDIHVNMDGGVVAYDA